MFNLYKIIFKDNTIYKGGTYKDTRWLQIPLKKIKEIEYITPFGKKITLSNYDKYYHFIEATTDLSGKEKGKNKLEYSYLIVKKDNKYKVHKISLQTGKIEILHLREEDKFIKQLNPIGWRG